MTTTSTRWRRCSASDVLLDVQWDSRARAYCLDTGESDLWSQVLDDRGWTNAGPLCENNEEARDVVAGRRLPPVAARRRCLYLTLLPEEVNILCRIPRDDCRWKLSLFPGIAAACTKSATAAQFAGMHSAHWPTSFVLPQDRDALETLAATARSSRSAKTYWIAKPEKAFGGSGIVVFRADSIEFQQFVQSERSALSVSRESKQGSEGKSYGSAACPSSATARQTGTVVQQYVHQPMLVGGYKFHIRVYICVTQLRPRPVAFVHTEGLVGFSTKPFSLDSTTLGADFDPLVHLTNTAVNITKEVSASWAITTHPSVHSCQLDINLSCLSLEVRFRARR